MPQTQRLTSLRLKSTEPAWKWRKCEKMSLVPSVHSRVVVRAGQSWHVLRSDWPVLFQQRFCWLFVGLWCKINLHPYDSAHKNHSTMSFGQVPVLVFSAKIPQTLYIINLNFLVQIKSSAVTFKGTSLVKYTSYNEIWSLHWAHPWGAVGSHRAVTGDPLLNQSNCIS